MDQQKRELDDKWRYYDEKLSSLKKRIDLVAKRLENGTLLSYPNPYYNDELFKLQEYLINETDRVLDEMEKLIDSYPINK